MKRLIKLEETLRVIFEQAFGIRLLIPPGFDELEPVRIVRAVQVKRFKERHPLSALLAESPPGRG